MSEKYPCPCKGECQRAENCAQCIEHHKDVGSVVKCMRPLAEKIYGGKKDEAES